MTERRFPVREPWQEMLTEQQRKILNAACGDLSAQIKWHGFRLTKDDWRHLLAGTFLGWRMMPGIDLGVDAPGTSPYFGLAWILKKNGLSIKDVKAATMSPQAAAQAFVAGQNDAAMTYEPYLSTVREKPDAGKIIATTLDYPMVMDTFGCAPKFLADNPKAARALADSYFEAIEMIAKEPKKSFEIMGADVKQTGEQFEASQKYLRWQDRAANRKFFTGEFQQFSKEAGDLLLEIGLVKQVPDINSLADTRFIQ